MKVCVDSEHHWTGAYRVARRHVGDPVDVVTGAENHFETDFRIPDSALPLSWVRHYDSRRCHEDRGLGPGFLLIFDSELRIDVDGLTFVDAIGRETSFPFLTADGEESQRDGFVLERADARTFLVHLRGGSPTLSFTFDRYATSTPPTAMCADRGRGPGLRFSYDAAGLSAVDLGQGRRLIVERTGARIVGVVLVNASLHEKKRLVRYEYDHLGRLIRAENSYGHSVGYRYDTSDRLAQKTDRRGYSFFFRYDDQGRCIHTRGEDGVAEFRLEYLPQEALTIVTRGDGAQTRYFYDRSGSLIQVIDPCGGLWSYLQDSDGRTVKEVDPLGNETLILYDGFDMPIAKRDPLGHRRALPIDPTPHPLDHFLPSRPGEWEHGWLYKGLAPTTVSETATVREAMTPAAVRATAAAPAAMDRLLPAWALQAVGPTPTAALEPITAVSDMQGVPLRDQNADGKVRRWGLDENGNLRWRTDLDGHTTHYEFSSWNMLRRLEEPLGRVVQFEYTIAEKRAGVTDAGGTHTEFAYDAKDRLIEVRRNGKVRDRYGYDAADNLIEKRDGDGELILKLTIGRGNLITRRQLGSDSNNAWELEHDTQGYLVKAKGPPGTCEFGHDAFGMQLRDERDGIGVRHIARAGHIVRTVVAGRFVTEYVTTADGSTLVRDPADQIHRLRRIARGLIERVASNGVREVAHYDLQGRCLLKVAEGPTFTGGGWARRFSYSAEGDLVAREDTARGRTVFLHDDARRLSSVTAADGSTTQYAYDRADNLATAPGLSATLNPGNKLAAVNGDTIEYNKRDQLAQRTTAAGGRTTYRYDARDHLIAVDGPGLTYRARHDALGRRTEKTVNGQTWLFYWDGDRLAAEVSPTGGWRVYVYSSPGALVPILFIDTDSSDADPRSGRRYHVYTDHLGCPELVLDEDGQTVWRARILPYGRAVVEVGADFHQPLRWPGHYHDVETDLHENRFRSYSPELGRYLQGDPAGIEGGLNLYAYTTNPLRAVDLDGLGQACPDDVIDCPHRKSDGPDQEGTGPKLPGVSSDERALAASSENTPAARAAREKVVKSFLKEHGLRFNHQTNQLEKLSDHHVQQELRGHDLNHPVSVGPPPAVPPQQVQFQSKGGKQGSYYTDEGTTPSQSGIAPVATNRDTGAIEPKEVKRYDMNPEAPYLESKAGPINDDWSVKGQAIPADGGGVQRVVPDRSMATAVDN